MNHKLNRRYENSLSEECSALKLVRWTRKVKKKFCGRRKYIKIELTAHRKIKVKRSVIIIPKLSIKLKMKKP